ncbi:PREDICTED: NEDD4-binding protein 1-like [Atta cephalotes]|uniref:RNase NYN domain-containing protein n=1 Tax=Atta cephalotes TaxID=12957 RepID=A0A158NEW4_ATTCE|nr:PREDICTED: NEDD4-binding protein 1-like [Atta cephalotes]
MKRKRSLNRQDSRYFYNSPLNVFRKSMVNFISLIDEKMVHKNRRLSGGKLKKQNAANSSKRIPSRNSIIVINDSDSERDDRNEDASLSVIECSSISSFQQNKKLKTATKKNTNKSSVISLDNDSSILCLTDMQECLNEESIAPSQTEDDVVELWSCLNSLNMSKDKKKHKREKNADKNKDVRHYFDETNEMFVIDTTPNLKYLKFLRDTNTDTSEYVWKRKRKQDVSSNKTIAKSFVKPIKRSTLKCSDNSQRKRHCGNWNPSPTKLNIRYSNKLQKEAEETQKNTDENIGTNSKYKLREIIVDGCNVAMNHTQGKEFSEKGIQIVVNYFKERGHIVKVFLPQHVRRKEHTFLEQLYKEGTVIFTPSRKIGGRQITSYDDRSISNH